MNLLLPVAGMSSRFPGMKPKWLLTHPNGNLMIIESILGLRLEEFKKIYIISLESHLKKYQFLDGLRKQFKSIGCLDKLEVVILKEGTSSQPETIAKGIEEGGIRGGIYIKDCDNFFVEDKFSGNFVSTYDLSNMNLVHAKNKSYIETNAKGMLVNIVEKKVVSSTFNVGGYGFESAKVFLKYYNSLKNESDLFVSHIIYKMILNGESFEKSDVKGYLDWGTLPEWNAYKSQYATVFINIDGILVENSEEFFDPLWGTTQGIRKNIESVNGLYATKKVDVILTTSRSKLYERQTIEQLKLEGVNYHQIVFGLFQGRSIVINNYDLRKPYKSCHSINIETDTASLDEMLKNFITP